MVGWPRVRLAPCLLIHLLWLFARIGALSAQEGSPDSAPPSQQAITDAITLTPHASCFERGAIEAQVEAWLGTAQVPADIRVNIEGDAQDPRSATFRIERAGAVRERRFDHLPLHCADATAVLGLAVALAIDASLLDDWIAPVQTMAPLAAAPALIRRPRLRLTLQLAAGQGAIPGTSGGAKLGLGYAPVPWLSVHMQALALFSFGNRVAGSIGVFDARAFAAMPSLCTGGKAGRIRLDLCTGAALGLLQVRGRNFVRSESQHGLWSVAVAGGRISLLMGSCYWALDVEGVFPLYVPAVAAADQANVSRRRPPDAAGVLVSLGPQLHF